MAEDFKLKVDLVKNVPFLLDAILEVGVGVVLITRENASVGILVLGWTLLVVGVIQFIRKVKTFHLTNAELVIKRPLFPFPNSRA